MWSAVCLKAFHSTIGAVNCCWNREELHDVEKLKKIFFWIKDSKKYKMDSVSMRCKRLAKRDTYTVIDFVIVQPDGDVEWYFERANIENATLRTLVYKVAMRTDWSCCTILCTIRESCLSTTFCIQHKMVRSRLDYAWGKSVKVYKHCSPKFSMYFRLKKISLLVESVPQWVARKYRF